MSASEQLSGASNPFNMLPIFFVFTQLALTSAQTEEPTPTPTQPEPTPKSTPEPTQIPEPRVAKNSRKGLGSNILRY